MPRSADQAEGDAGDPSEIGEKSILKLLEALDTAILDPEGELDKPFLMSVEDVFTITGRDGGDGRIERGRVKVGTRSRSWGIQETGSLW